MELLEKCNVHLDIIPDRDAGDYVFKLSNDVSGQKIYIEEQNLKYFIKIFKICKKRKFNKYI